MPSKLRLVLFFLSCWFRAALGAVLLSRGVGSSIVCLDFLGSVSCVSCAGGCLSPRVQAVMADMVMQLVVVFMGGIAFLRLLSGWKTNVVLSRSLVGRGLGAGLNTVLVWLFYFTGLVIRGWRVWAVGLLREDISLHSGSHSLEDPHLLTFRVHIYLVEIGFRSCTRHFFPSVCLRLLPSCLSADTKNRG